MIHRMPGWWVRRAPALMVLVALGTACSGAGGSGPGVATGVPAAASEEPTRAPDFTLTTVDGEPFHFAETQGRVRLVDFWATWCAPCREEIPMFRELHEAYSDEGFMIIGIAMDEGGAEVVRPFVEKYHVPYLNLIGNEEVEQAFGGIFGYPTAFLVDRDGVIVETFIGAKPRKKLEAKILKLLHGSPEETASNGT